MLSSWNRNSVTAFAGSFKRNIFENLAIVECFKTVYIEILSQDFIFTETHKAMKSILLYQEGRKLIPIEIKSSSTFS